MDMLRNRITSKIGAPLAVSMLLLAACASATPPTESQTPTEVHEPATEEPATEQPVPQAGPDEVVVSGALNVTFTTSMTSVVDWNRTHYGISLQLVADKFRHIIGDSGVIILIPKRIQPGNYSIGNSTGEGDKIILTFWYTIDQKIYFGGTGGSLELTETGNSFSGSFTFTAHKEYQPSHTIIVTGNFEGALVPQFGSGEVAVTGAVNLTYIPLNVYIPISVEVDWSNMIILEVESDVVSGIPRGVTIHIPDAIQPGTYDIGPFPDKIWATFVGPSESYGERYASTDGSIEFTATGDVYSGSFAFNAADYQTATITVTGYFEGAAPRFVP